MQDNMKATEDAEEKKGGERKKESEREGGTRRGKEACWIALLGSSSTVSLLVKFMDGPKLHKGLH